MRARRNPARTNISVCWNINAPLALNRKIETKSLSINLHQEEVEAFTPRSKVVGFFGLIELRIQGVKQAVKYPFLIFLSNSNSRILDLEKYPLILLSQNDPD